MKKIWIPVLFCFACGSVPEPVGEGTRAAFSLLSFVNASTTTQKLLDDTVGLDSRAAKNIAAHVRGPDGVYGTADDQPFKSIGELDAIPYVSMTTIDEIADYVQSTLGPSDLTVEGVPMSLSQAGAIVDVANKAKATELDENVGLDSRAAKAIVAARPFASVDAVAAAPYVGKVALEKLKAYAANH